MRHATNDRDSNSTKVDQRFEKVVAAYATDKHVKKGRSFSSENVLSVNGKIFAMLYKGTFVLKLPAERVDQLVSLGLGVNWGPSKGRTMKEWIAIESERASWLELSREAYAFVKAGTST